MKVIILAGGSGARLWPVSRDLYPKALLSLYEGRPLIEHVYSLALSIAGEEDIITVTNTRLFNNIKTALRNITDNPKIIAEPMSKNTACAIGCGLVYLSREENDDEVLIMPADFAVNNKKAFKNAVLCACDAAEEGYIAALGVKPEYPDSGFGYIQTEKAPKNAVKAVKFIEKPDIKEAEEFIKSKNYFWNCGIYVSKISVLLDEINKYAPSAIEGFSKKMFGDNNIINYDYYENRQEISIERAVIEKTDLLFLAPLKTSRQDFGSWRDIYNYSEKDSKGNALQGAAVLDGVKDSLVYASKEPAVVLSVKNMIIADTEDALLVCSKDKVSEINKLFEKIKKDYSDETLSRKTVIRPWGEYTCLNKGQGWLTKIITVLPGHKLSYQSHNYRSEHWVVLEGEAAVVLEEKIMKLRKGTSINIPVEAKHSLQNDAAEPLKILEVQKGEYIAEDDIIRYEDMYGRIV